MEPKCSLGVHNSLTHLSVLIQMNKFQPSIYAYVFKRSLSLSLPTALMHFHSTCVPHESSIYSTSLYGPNNISWEVHNMNLPPQKPPNREVVRKIL